MGPGATHIDCFPCNVLSPLSYLDAPSDAPSDADSSPTVEELEQAKEHARDVARVLLAKLPAKADAGVLVIQILNLVESLAAAAFLGVEQEAHAEDARICPLLNFLTCFGV